MEFATLGGQPDAGTPMNAADRSTLDPVISAIYDTSLSADGWPALLSRLSDLFHAGFADVFSRSDDRSQFHGLAHGLDRDDYDDVFLGHWFKRNVWGLRHPVKIAGEIMQTREMVPVDELVRSEIYNDYLAPRGLHEGLRMAIHAGDGWIQDLSLLRPFSLGPYDGVEIAMAEILLPHLQRAAAVARRLGEADAAMLAGQSAFDSFDRPAFTFDASGRVLHHNAAAEAILLRGDVLSLHHGVLSAAMPAISQRIADSVGAHRKQAHSIRLPYRTNRAPAAEAVLTTVPLGAPTGWAMLRPAATMAFVNETPLAGLISGERLVSLFQLTAAEVELALDLVAGHGLSEIAERRARSINTVRTHLRHLMAKLGVHRQSEVIRLLMSLPAH